MSDPIHELAVEVASLEDYYDHFGFADAQAEPGGLAKEIAHMLHDAPNYVINRMYGIYADTGDCQALRLATDIRRECCVPA